jgi:hypothetical protein
VLADSTDQVPAEVTTRPAPSSRQREEDLAEALAFLRLDLAAPAWTGWQARRTAHAAAQAPGRAGVIARGRRTMG